MPLFVAQSEHQCDPLSGCRKPGALLLGGGGGEGGLGLSGTSLMFDIPSLVYTSVFERRCGFTSIVVAIATKKLALGIQVGHREVRGFGPFLDWGSFI